MSIVFGMLLTVAVLGGLAYGAVRLYKYLTKG